MKKQEENALIVTAKKRLEMHGEITVTVEFNVFSAKNVDEDLVKRQVYLEIPIITLVVKYAFP